MKHMVIILNLETRLLDIVLRWPFHAPIGPRLEKGLPMPKVKSVGWENPDEAIEACKVLDRWFDQQETGKTEVVVKTPDVAPIQQKKEVLPPPPPRPAPPPKAAQDDMFSDLC